MRLILRSSNKDQIRILCHKLKSHEIQYSLDAIDHEILVWIIDEDDFSRAEPLIKEAAHSGSVLDRYIFNRFHIDAFKKIPKSFYSITYLLICLSTLLLFLDKWTNDRVPVAFGYTIAMASSVQEVCLFDTSVKNDLLGEFILSHMQNQTFDLQKLSQANQETFQKLSSLPSWEGLYPYFVSLMQHEPYTLDFSPLFEKIREGEVWRLFTPSLIHVNILHLLFNMMWLFVLGKELESSLKRTRFLVLMLIIACFSNTCQYLMSGPYFMGFSGVIAGLAGFIAVRKSRHPWEYYLINNSSISFVKFFIGILGLASLFSFLLEGFFKIEFPAPFANTAHISGFLVGALLGMFRYFSATHKHKTGKEQSEL